MKICVGAIGSVVLLSKTCHYELYGNNFFHDFAITGLFSISPYIWTLVLLLFCIENSKTEKDKININNLDCDGVANRIIYDGLYNNNKIS